MATAPDSGVSSMSPDSPAYGIESVGADAIPESTTSVTVQSEQETHQDSLVSSSQEPSEEAERGSAAEPSHSGEFNKERFDFTLWYHEDDDSVAEEVRTFLEDRHHLSGFIEERDFTPGKSKFSNLDRGINNSDKILFIVSRNSIKSAWFERIIHQSLITALEDHHDRFCVIPIYVDLEKKETPSALRTLAGVKYTAKHFWKRLENTMGLSGLAANIRSPTGGTLPSSSSSISPPIQANSLDSSSMSLSGGNSTQS